MKVSSHLISPMSACVMVLAIAACSDAPEPDDFVRVIDRLDQLEVTSAVDLSDADLVRSSFGTSLGKDTYDQQREGNSLSMDRKLLSRWLPDLPMSPGSVAFDTDRGVCVLEGPAAYVTFFELDDRRKVIRAELQAQVESDQPTIFTLVELERIPPPEAFASEELMGTRIVSQIRGGHQLITPPGLSTGMLTYQTSFPQGDKTRVLMLVVMANSGTITLDHFELFSSPPLMAKALERRDEFEHPHIARVEVAEVFCESILLGTPGEVRFPLVLPTRQPLLRFSVAELENQTPREIVVEVQAFLPGSESPELVFDPVRYFERDPQFRPFEFDLSPLAGRDAEISIRVRARDNPEGPVGVAIANPVVEGLPEPGTLPPDVILISLDTVRADRLSVYGNENATSPHLQALGDESVVFERAISASSWTLPSHASTLTGQLPARHGVLSKTRRFDPKTAPLIAREFRDQGYETIAVTAGGYVHPDFGFAKGFERYGIRELVEYATEAGDFVRVDSSPQMKSLSTKLSSERRRPLFLFVHTYAAHNYVAVEEDMRAVGASEDEIASVSGHDIRLQTFERLRKTSSEMETSLVRRLYDSTILGADKVVGDVMRGLEDGGRADESIVIVTSDHGEELFEHGQLGHGSSLCEELLWVPLLIKAPGIEPRREDAVVSLVDIVPTLREMCSLDQAGKVDGESLLPLLSGDFRPPSPVVSQVDIGRGQANSIRGERWKLIISLVKGREVVQRSLFDLASDPKEDLNLADERPRDVARMESSILAYLALLEKDGGQVIEGEVSPERQRELESLGYVGDG